MSVLLGENAKNFVEEYVKINPAGIDIKPKKIYKIPEKEIKYILIDGDKRGYFFNLNIEDYEELFEITIDENKRKKILEESFRKIPDSFIEIKPKGDYWILNKGLYYVIFPKVKIPKDFIAIAFPRSTFNRLGILKFESALFDPGYEGEFTQTYYFPIKAKININEAWIQLVFFKLEGEVKEGYKGYWHGEKY
ncbi:MAG: dCTP deaminase [Nanopusillaceae archaeon]|jgi:deoxycytidine triphosphate deaminase